MAAKKPDNLSFEQAIEELTQLVNEMEHGELSLEQSLKHFERGINLANASTKKLSDAQQKVSILLGQQNNSPLGDFENQPE